jgi:hypothetical protein
MLGGMLVAGVGARFLNGEIAKVGMTVIPPEHAGMASGVGGTARFSGIVVGFAALGAVLFGRVSAVVSAGLPAALPADRLALVRSVTAGDLSGNRHALVLASFGAGYQAILLVAAVIAATLRCSAGSWSAPATQPQYPVTPGASRTRSGYGIGGSP